MKGSLSRLLDDDNGDKGGGKEMRSRTEMGQSTVRAPMIR